MPELIEVEYYRKALTPLIGSELRSVTVDPLSFLRPAGTPASIFDPLIGSTLARTRRIGKLLILEMADGQGASGEIGLRFGMTGRLLVDGVGPIERLEYSSGRNEPRWDRAVLDFGSLVAIRDQRKLGSIEVDPDIEQLGPDVLTLDGTAWKALLSRRRRSIKSALLDQSLVAGLGNLLADEILWRASMAPMRAGSSLSDEELARLGEVASSVIDELTARGGSHRGDSFALRNSDAECSLCGETMSHETIGGRSTWWCSGHQR